ncbi:MAG: CRISPR-associated protein Cas4 [Bacteroidia bacterium]|nr:CRISPR-associated protein Cas4 [Bacteroidia bacterium]MDW8158528.1 CRISPR-associated protein Cas4 [Bacteroidia bacterium]
MQLFELVSGTEISYLASCKRRLWLFQHGIQLEKFSDLVQQGRILEEYAYTRRKKKFQGLAIARIKIDYLDAQSKTVREIKRSPAFQSAHIWQLKFYLYVLSQYGFQQWTGILEYPRFHQTQIVTLIPEDIPILNKMMEEVIKTRNSKQCPPVVNKPFCKKCAYYEFCYADE